MKLGILLCDDHYPDSIPEYGHYDDAFKRMFAGSGITEFASYRCHEEDYPPCVEACDIWLVTGSKWGVYDTDLWIGVVAQFIRDCDDAGKPLIGICFGHQLIHHALGGEAVKSDKGWGMGLYPVSVESQPDWVKTPLPETLNLIACHQDQVRSPAPGFTIIAGSSFCPVAITHKANRVLTMQCHPEFTPEFLRQLIERLRDKAGNHIVDNAIQSLDTFGEGERQAAIHLIFQFAMR